MKIVIENGLFAHVMAKNSEFSNIIVLDYLCRWWRLISVHLGLHLGLFLVLPGLKLGSMMTVVVGVVSHVSVIVTEFGNLMFPHLRYRHYSYFKWVFIFVWFIWLRVEGSQYKLRAIRFFSNIWFCCRSSKVEIWSIFFGLRSHRFGKFRLTGHIFGLTSFGSIKNHTLWKIVAHTPLQATVLRGSFILESFALSPTVSLVQRSCSPWKLLGCSGHAFRSVNIISPTGVEIAFAWVFEIVSVSLACNWVVFLVSLFIVVT